MLPVVPVIQRLGQKLVPLKEAVKERQAAESSATSNTLATPSLFGHIPHPHSAEPRPAWRVTRGNAGGTALVL